MTNFHKFSNFSTNVQPPTYNVYYFHFIFQNIISAIFMFHFAQYNFNKYPYLGTFPYFLLFLEFRGVPKYGNAVPAEKGVKLLLYFVYK